MPTVAAGDDVRDLGLVHAACIATIERSALVTTLFTVRRQAGAARAVRIWDYRRHPGRHAAGGRAAHCSPPSDPATADLRFWLNWTKFDYLYVLFTEEGAANPDPQRLTLVVEGENFQLYRVLKEPQVRAEE